MAPANHILGLTSSSYLAGVALDAFAKMHDAIFSLNTSLAREIDLSCYRDEETGQWLCG